MQHAHVRRFSDMLRLLVMVNLTSSHHRGHSLFHLINLLIILDRANSYHRTAFGLVSFDMNHRKRIKVGQNVRVKGKKSSLLTSVSICCGCSSRCLAWYCFPLTLDNPVKTVERLLPSLLGCLLNDVTTWEVTGGSDRFRPYNVTTQQSLVTGYFALNCSHLGWRELWLLWVKKVVCWAYELLNYSW